jgi:hypothetical protein
MTNGSYQLMLSNKLNIKFNITFNTYLYKLIYQINILKNSPEILKHLTAMQHYIAL